MDLDLWLYPERDYGSGGMLIFDEGELGCEIQKNTNYCGYNYNDTASGDKAAFLAQ